jgi:hypothetical protein
MKRYVLGIDLPRDGLKGVWDGLLSVLLALGVVAVVTLGSVVSPFVAFWRLLTRQFST